MSTTLDNQEFRSRRGPTPVIISEPDADAENLSTSDALGCSFIGEKAFIEEQGDDEAELKERLAEAEKLIEAVSRPRAKATKTREDKISDLFSFVVRSNTPKVNSEGVEVHRDLLMTWLYGRPAKSAY